LRLVKKQDLPRIRKAGDEKLKAGQFRPNKEDSDDE
jgi:hypothetical protein